MRKLYLLLIAIVPTITLAQLSSESAWLKIDETTRKQLDSFSEDYKQFLHSAKTELTAVREIRQQAEAAGFERLAHNSSWQTGRRYYVENRERAICLIVAGEESLAGGVRVIAGHLDSPRIELKARPLYQKEQFALFQTVYHGGLKKYQWVNRPLALSGRIDKTDGSTVWINIGDDESEPTFIIPDLAPHVDRFQRERSQREVIKGEELDPVAGTLPGQTTVEDEVLRILDEKYAVARADFISAELALVPALKPRDVGFDRTLLAAYGQDDKSSCFPALRASIAITGPSYTTISYFADNEESGSNNNTGAGSRFFPALLDRLVSLHNQASGKMITVDQVLENTVVLSADATTGIHPQFPDVQEKTNAGRLGYGVVIKRYGKGSDPRSEILARFRAALEMYNIPYQTHTYKVDVGGGGTLGEYLATMNTDVIDVGIALLSMHSPYEIASKVDIWFLYQAFLAFYR